VAFGARTFLSPAFDPLKPPWTRVLLRPLAIMVACTAEEQRLAEVRRRAKQADWTVSEGGTGDSRCDWTSRLTLFSRRVDLSTTQPQPIEESTLQAWYMDDSDEDQRLPHR